MTNKVMLQHMDIYQYPKTTMQSLGVVTLGDLHGNAVKLLHFLMLHGVVIWKASVVDRAGAYQSFVQIYERAAEILKFRALMTQFVDPKQGISNPEEYARLKSLSAPKELMILLRQFNDLISQLAVQEVDTHVRLLGDELADRGSNDYFTLRLLGLLYDAHVAVSILSSNHGVQFLKNYEEGSS
ncbi:MAG: hypothetical protein NTW94_07755 [Legionellales bacterium]|nr:hypothetical protein [Legionellales bacterium]